MKARAEIATAFMAGVSYRAGSRLRTPLPFRVTSESSSARSRPTVALSMGDPGGIGPEIIVKALADPVLRRRARFRIFGAAGPMHAAAQLAGIDPFWWQIHRGSDLLPAAACQEVVLIDDASCADGEFSATPSKVAGELSFRWLDDAIELCRDTSAEGAQAIVTGPICKESWDLAKKTRDGRFPGHTEVLTHRFRAKRTAMMFESPKLRVVLATCHIPVACIPDELTIGRVFDAIELGHEACSKLGIDAPRIAVCGVNPHAGEGGMLGEEEQRIVEPAIELAIRQGINAKGPFPADTIFNAAAQGRYDLVVAMYHDQGLIPVKLLGWESAVNVTLGLPIVRTSPDHGTAFDIAGRNKAEASSMKAALNLAINLLGGIRPVQGSTADA